MPKLFTSEHLHELDMAEYEEAPPVDHKEVLEEMKKKGVILEADEEEERRQALQREVVGEMMPQVKHHLSRAEVSCSDRCFTCPSATCYVGLGSRLPDTLQFAHLSGLCLFALLT